MDAASARQYLDAGARVLGIGSALEDPAQLDKLVELLRNGKSQPRPRGWLFGRGWPQLPTFRTVTEALAVAADR